MTVLTSPKHYRCRAYDRLSVTTGAVVNLSAAKILHPTYGPCQVVVLTVEDNDIRRRVDGVAVPSTGADGDGALRVDGTVEVLNGSLDVKQLAMIAVSATAIVHVDYYYEK